AVKDHADQRHAAAAQLGGVGELPYAGEDVIDLQAAGQGAGVGRLDDGAVGDGVAVGKADLDDIGAGLDDGAAGGEGGRQVGVAGGHEGDERLAPLPLQPPEELVDGVHGRLLQPRSRVRQNAGRAPRVLANAATRSDLLALQAGHLVTVL